MSTGEPQPQKIPSTSRQRATREIKRAERLAATGHVPEAIASLDQAMQLGADRYTCYLRQARLYQERRQWTEAVSAAEKAIAEHPTKLSAREAIITLFLESRDYVRAVDASKALLKISPRHVPARDALGAAYIGMGDIDGAIRVATDLIRMDPANASHRFNRAHLCQHRGEIKMAVEEFERVLQLTEETDLVESAREQLDAMDAYQMNQILILAFEDSIFRAKLIRDAVSAAQQKGFFLSEAGRQALTDTVADSLADLDLPYRPSQYH
jgi:tetratricopeptide (TPR) repeat protein